jgi:hypothetical protein
MTHKAMNVEMNKVELGNSSHANQDYDKKLSREMLSTLNIMFKE